MSLCWFERTLDDDLVLVAAVLTTTEQSVQAPPCTRAHLGGSEAESGGDGVRPLPVLEHQPRVLCQRQVVAGGQVPQSERLTPSDVAPAPAAGCHSDDKLETEADTGGKKGFEAVFHNLRENNL